MRRLACLVSLVLLLGAGGGLTASGADTLTGASAFGDWSQDAPGVRRLITPGDLPKPFTPPVGATGGGIARRPADALPKVPAGFSIGAFAGGLHGPRSLRVGPNGDVFVAESDAGRIRVLRAGGDGTHVGWDTVYASGLHQPFGIAFYPPGPAPQYLYVGDTDGVVRFPYAVGDTIARGPAEDVVAGLPTGGHWTRDVAFSPDGKTMYVSVGSATNDGETGPRRDHADIIPFEIRHALGSAWGPDEWRADVLAFDPDGSRRRIFATGLRNCVSMAIKPGTDDLWCVTNERDGFGDNLPPDYATHVSPGAFYGWPWYYIGAHEDPRHQGERTDLADHVTVPDVLLQAHSAPLGIAFYTGAQFPAEYRGDAFVALHGSWNRSKRTGYKVVRLIFKDGKPTGAYEDFMVGLVGGDNMVWGRPVGVAVAADGALLVSDDAAGAIWRIAYHH